MSVRFADDPVLRRFKASLQDLYGVRLERVVLFGSRARGDERPDSDYDIAVFLHDSAGLWTEREPMAAVELAILEETGKLINALPLPAKGYEARTLLMHELRHEGVDL